MMDVSTLYNKFAFIGNEFLTWLLFMIKKNNLEDLIGETASLEIGNCIVMENTKGDSNKTVTIKNDYTNLEEGMICLRMGALVSKINLIYTNEDKNWIFTLIGKDLNFISLKLPTNNTKIKNDIEYFFLEKVDLCDRAISLLICLFKYFIKLRISNEWSDETIISMRSWINNK